jgi:hypothetical protein
MAHVTINVYRDTFIKNPVKFKISDPYMPAAEEMDRQH